MMTHPENKFSGGWFKEWLTPQETHSHKLKKVLARMKTKFQNAVVADFHSFGRCLVLDGEMQSARLDEFIYHEALIHPAFITHPRPEKALILGGGEGATLREILKYKSIQNCKMVDIDGEVVKLCERLLEPWHKGSFRHPNAEVIIADAKKFVEETQEKFDVIVSDLPTPSEGGPVSQLYSKDFYRTLKSRLNPDGLLTLQAGSANLLEIRLHLNLFKTLKQVFPVVRSYSTHIPSFDVPWAFLVCSQNRQLDPLNISSAEIDRRIGQRLSEPLQFYDGITHEGLLRVPKHIRGRLK